LFKILIIVKEINSYKMPDESSGIFVSLVFHQKLVCLFKDNQRGKLEKLNPFN